MAASGGLGRRSLLTGPDPGARPPLRARLTGPAGLLMVAISVAAMLAVSLLGPSAAVPELGAGAPPWSLRLDPPQTPVIQLGWVALLIGGLGTCAALYALRRGWLPVRGLFAAGTPLVVVLLTLVPPAGSTDVLNYAVYGRIAALGHDPYVTPPAWLHGIGDPVGDLTPLAWRNTPSVYGPLATWAQLAASRLGGDSMAATVFAFKVILALAFLLSAVMLDRLAGPERDRRVRAHLLWSLNPLMLWHVVLGGHMDGLGAFLLVAALFALRRPGMGSGLVSGALLGAAAAVKAPFVLAGAGLAWAARHRAGPFLTLGMGAFTALVTLYATQGPQALANVAGKVGDRSLADPWQVLVKNLGPEAVELEGRLALGAALLAALLLCWRLPQGPPGLPAVRPALAWCLGWLLTSPVQHPWYDAMLFPLLALMPASRLDGPLLVRGVVTGLVYLPGATALLRLQPTPLTRWIAEVYRPWIAPLVSDAVILYVVVLALAGALGLRALPVVRRAAVPEREPVHTG
ncbi:polyprenol phosphomannose-dependent alpha 1,6 mannosyltransferase MptB [Streptosporangium jomthongense]|uniref:Polyprenol phosphomannose-dependent alpha 1,6 mannosyltransferase MptB n=1 Tax=Streptosporangium jomthongense TaxID=1193683 RepID=A0ABV8EZ50_9ACTN